MTTPRDHGFAMPAEWAAHAGCWMIWPERPDNWRLGAKPAQAAFVGGGVRDCAVRAGDDDGERAAIRPGARDAAGGRARG